jgi:hypothetical protein
VDASSNTPPTRDEIEQLAARRITEVAGRRTTPPRPEDIDRAASLLTAWWLAGLENGIEPEAFDWTGDLAGTAYDAAVLVRTRRERSGRRWVDSGSGPGWSPDPDDEGDDR